MVINYRPLAISELENRVHKATQQSVETEPITFYINAYINLNS